MAQVSYLADTSFGTKPDDSVVAVDIYNKPPATPQNNRLGQVDAKTLLKMAGGSDAGKNIFKSITSAYVSGKLDSKDAAISAITSSLGISKGAISNLSAGVLTTMLKGGGFYGTGIGKVVDGLAKVTTGNALSTKNISGWKDITLVVGGVKTYVKNLKDIDSLTSLSKVLGSITGDNALLKALNLTQVASTIVGLNKLANSFNIPSVFDKLIKSLTSDSTDAKLVTALVATGTSNYGDLNFVNSLLSHLSGSELLAARPTIIKDIVAGFNASSSRPSPTAEVAATLLATLEVITPHWFEVLVDSDQGLWLSNLDIFKSFSSFAKTAFINAGFHLSELACVTSYSTQPFVTVVKQYYPYAAISTGKKS